MRRAQRTACPQYLPAACRTAGVLGAIMVLAACAAGSSGAGPSTGMSGNAGGTARADGSTAANGSPGPPASDRAEGDALARQLLSRLILPPGTRRLAAAPASLSPGNSPAAWAADLHRAFLLPIPEAAAIPFQRAHSPAGLRPDGNGEITSYGPPEVQEYDWSQRKAAG